MSAKDKGAARAEVKSDAGVKGILSAFTAGASAADLDGINAEYEAADDVDMTDDSKVDGPGSEHSVHSRDGTEEDTGESDEPEEPEEEPADEAPVDEPEADDEAPETPAAGGAEEFWVTDDAGRRKVSVDFGDTRQKQQLVGAAYGMKKFRAERDAATAKLRDYEHPEGKAAKELAKFREMDRAFAEGGPAAVLASMGIDADKFIDEKVLHRANLEKLKGNPQAWAEYQTKLANERADKEVAKIRAEREAEKAERAAEVESSNQSTFDSARERAFGRIRMDDSSAENGALNEMMWDSLNARIDRLPDDTVLTDAVLSQVAQDVARSLGARVRKEANARVAATMDRKRTEAGKAAQAQMRRGSERQGQTQKMEEAFDKGGVRGLLARAWGK